MTKTHDSEYLGFQVEVAESHFEWIARAREHSAVLRFRGAKNGITYRATLEIWPKDQSLPMMLMRFGSGFTPREAIADAFDDLAFERLRSVWLFDALPEWVKELAP